MKRKVLVIGKLNQLGPLLKPQIIASLQSAKLITDKEQVVFITTNHSPQVIARECKRIGATHTLPIGLKSHMLKEYIEQINQISDNVYHMVVCTDGPVPLFPRENNVTDYQTLEQLGQNDFSKQKEMAY